MQGPRKRTAGIRFLHAGPAVSRRPVHGAWSYSRTAQASRRLTAFRVDVGTKKHPSFALKGDACGESHGPAMVRVIPFQQAQDPGLAGASRMEEGIT